MGWVGGTIGFLVGSRFGALAGILGAAIGNKIGNFVGEGLGNLASKSQREKRPYANARGRASSHAGSPREREIIFLTAVGAMLAKLAKADGHIDESEIAAAEQAFVRLKLTPANRAICIRAFRAAKADYHTIFDYAESFAFVSRGVVIRELMYDILWDVACADRGVPPSPELASVFASELFVRAVAIRHPRLRLECDERRVAPRLSRTGEEAPSRSLASPRAPRRDDRPRDRADGAHQQRMGRDQARPRHLGREDLRREVRLPYFFPATKAASSAILRSGVLPLKSRTNATSREPTL